MFCKICGKTDKECKINNNQKKCYVCIRLRMNEIKELKQNGLWFGRDNSYLKERPPANQKTAYKNEDGIDYKLCPNCQEWKTYINFHLKKDNKNGMATFCKSCKKEKDAMSHQMHKKERNAKAKIWYENNKEKVSELNKEYRSGWDEERKQKEKDRLIKYREENAEHHKAVKKAYYEKTKDKYFERLKERKRNDVNLRIRCNLRTRVSMAVRGVCKSKKTIDCDCYTLTKSLNLTTI